MRWMGSRMNFKPSWHKMAPATTDWREAATRCGIPLSVIHHPTLHVSQLLCSRGERSAAEAACREMLRQRPNDIPVWKWLASFLEVDARFPEAEFCHRRAHELDLRRSGLPEKKIKELLRFRMAAEGYGRGPARAPRVYVSGLFDSCAEDFDGHLRNDLGYCGPELVCGALLRSIRRRRRPLDILDAGCGTGLAGPLLRPRARRLDGVDLSGKMLEKAKAGAFYDKLRQSDLVRFLVENKCSYDAIVAVDVLVYFGSLAPILSHAYGALRRHGLFVFSVEAATSGSYHLAPTRRYVHSEAYLRKCATAAGFRILTMRRETLRLERKQPVPGRVVVLRRQGNGTARTSVKKSSS
jgi:predicted TPR repeat methyltransferase